MTKTENIAKHYILFISSSKNQGYKPSIVETERHNYLGKHLYTFHTKGYPDLEAIKNRSNEELIRYLNNEGFEDVEFYELEGWIGFERADAPLRFLQ
ncbi:MAG: hypothetical protein V7K89_28055 [Nostoc sp.]|uniref:hypothetical protein n=1 Tax=Nostoc sp. TaxID=1180 RepID=UPI002FF5975E